MKDEKNNDNNSNLAIGICLGVLFGTALDILFGNHKKK